MSSVLKVDAIQNTAGTSALTIDSSGFLKGAKESLFRAYQSSSQTISNNSTTVIAYDAEDFDPNGWYDTSTYKFTPTIAGYYAVTASLRYNTDADWDICDMYIYKNTSIHTNVSDGHQRYDTLNGTDIIYLNGSSDYVQVKTLQVSGSDKTLRNVQADTFFHAFRLAT